MRGSGVFAGLVFITLELDVASVSSARWAYVSLNAKTRIAVMPARMITRRREKPAAARKSRRYARFERDLRVISCTTLYSSCADRMPSRSLSSDLRRLYTSSSNFETRPSPSRSGLSTFRSIVPARFSPPFGADAFLPAAVSAGFDLSGGVAGGALGRRELRRRLHLALEERLLRGDGLGLRHGRRVLIRRSASARGAW